MIICSRAGVHNTYFSVTEALHFDTHCQIVCLLKNFRTCSFWVSHWIFSLFTLLPLAHVSISTSITIVGNQCARNASCPTFAFLDRFVHSFLLFALWSLLLPLAMFNLSVWWLWPLHWCLFCPMDKSAALILCFLSWQFFLWQCINMEVHGWQKKLFDYRCWKMNLNEKHFTPHLAFFFDLPLKNLGKFQS